MVDRKEQTRIGQMLNQFYNFEGMLNELITSYFKPEKNAEFRNYLMNTSITPFGSKVKLLPNIMKFEKKEIEMMRELGSIRNGIAHSTTHFLIDSVSNNKKIDSKITVMNSSGKLVTKDFWQQSERFDEILDKVVPVVLEKTSNLK